MNKLGIWAIAIAGAFLIGIVSANPVVEAVGGWQLAFDGLDARVTQNEIDIANIPPPTPPFDDTAILAQLADHETRITTLENTAITTIKTFSGSQLFTVPAGNQIIAQVFCSAGQPVVVDSWYTIPNVASQALIITQNFPVASENAPPNNNARVVVSNPTTQDLDLRVGVTCIDTLIP